LGIEHALFAFARISAPSIGIHLLQNHGMRMVAVSCSLIFMLVLLLWRIMESRNVIKPNLADVQLTDMKKNT
jgi:hypothetical protein